MQRMARDCRDAPARAAMKRAKAFNVGLPRRFRRPRHNRVTERGLCWRLAGQILVNFPRFRYAGGWSKKRVGARRSFARN
jgi:hypothetical protein